MEAEAAPIVKRLGLHFDDPRIIPGPSTAQSYSGTAHDLTVHLVVNGKDTRFEVDNVGTPAASLTTYLAAQAFKPDLVISLGTAGGFKTKGAAIGSVFVGTSTVNHDRRIPLPGFDKYGLWHCDCIPTPNLQKALKLQAGVVSSGNSLDWVKEDWDIMQQNGAAVKEMEAAGIAWALHYFDIPFFCLKSITDIVDGDRPPQEEFLENLGAAAQALQDTVAPVLEFISGKSVEAL
ncbi:hypothetical protein WJX74_007745 [Apatococcus lobatus]|uniref:Nucleoside phosphorylase domain-containing protein n=1 Tax=Apatococcus lobatus TaxID=904363 RepID=A0AAW1QJQ6_9CHLO